MMSDDKIKELQAEFEKEKNATDQMLAGYAQTMRDRAVCTLAVFKSIAASLVASWYINLALLNGILRKLG